MIDPLTRWAAYGEKPDYAGLLTYAGLPYTEDPAELRGRGRRDRRRADGRADVGLAGHALRPAGDPRRVAARPGRTWRRASTRCATSCGSIDFGDAPILPADPVRSHDAIQDTVAQVLAAGAIPIILGGDHSIAEPDIRAVRGASTARSA